MRLTMNDRTVEGTPLQIVQSMRAIEFGNSASDAQYMAGVAARLVNFGHAIDLDAYVDDELKAAELVRVLLTAGLARRS